MDSLTNGLQTVPDCLPWLPDPRLCAATASVLIILLAAAIALAIHNRLRALTRRLIAPRSPQLFSMMSQMRGLTRLAQLVPAMRIAVPVASIEPFTKALLGQRSSGSSAGRSSSDAYRRGHLSAPVPPRQRGQPARAQAQHAGARASAQRRRTPYHHHPSARC
jgi:hypothetical protein